MSPRNEQMFPLHCSRTHVPVNNITPKAFPRKNNNVFSVLLRYICRCQQYETHFGLDAKCPILLSITGKIWSFLTNLFKSPQYKISQKSVQWKQRWYMQTDRHDEANNTPFATYANASKILDPNWLIAFLILYKTAWTYLGISMECPILLSNLTFLDRFSFPI